MQKPKKGVRATSFLRLLDHTQLGAPQSVRLLWARDQPDAETSTWQHTTTHAPDGIFFVPSVLSPVLSFISIVYLYILCPHVTYSSTTHNTSIHNPGRIRSRDRSKRVATNPHLTPPGYLDRRILALIPQNYSYLVKKGKAFPLQAWTGPWGFQEFEAPEFLDNRHMKVVRLSALRTGRQTVSIIHKTQVCMQLKRTETSSPYC
jgi:hypothetical protein